MLAGARMLLPWRWAQALCEAALAAILLYCAISRLKGADWRRFAPAAGGALAALSAAAGLAVLVGVFAGFSWSLSMGIAALGFGLDSLWDALGSMQAARGMIRGDINGASPRRGGAHIFYEGEIHHMQTASARDERFRPIALGAEIFYALFSAYLVVSGAVTGNSYRLTMGIGTYFLYPPLLGVLQAVSLEARLSDGVLRVFLHLSGLPAGRHGEFYQKIQGFDKVAHTLSGVFVAMLALTLFLILQRKRPLKEHSVPTAVLFVFFASMAVAGLLNCASGRRRRSPGATCNAC